MCGLRSFLVYVAMALAVCPLVSLSEEGDRTLLVLPRKDAPVRVGLDIGNRYPTMLLTYKLAANDSLSLHGWSGDEWVNVTPEAYGEGAFFVEGPASTVIVVADGEDLPERLIPDESWCSEVYLISSVQIRPLLHLLGRHYDFKYKDWKWFSENYRLPIDSINPDKLNIAWYHQRLADNLKSSGADDLSDLRYLKVVRSQQLVDSDEADMPADDELQEVDDAAEDIALEIDDEVQGNPFTNEVPQAVVLGDDAAAQSSDDQADSKDEEDAEE